MSYPLYPQGKNFQQAYFNMNDDDDDASFDDPSSLLFLNNYKRVFGFLLGCFFDDIK